MLSEEKEDNVGKFGNRALSLMSIHSPAPLRDISFNQVHQVAYPCVFRQPFSIVDTKDLHPFVILEIRKKLGSDKEILR